MAKVQKEDQRVIVTKSGTYVETNEGREKVCNFIISIAEEVQHIAEDGTVSKKVKLKVKYKGKLIEFFLTYDAFIDLKWIPIYIDFEAYVDYKVKSKTQFISLIIQLSKNRFQRTLVNKCGYYQHGDELCYLHNGGALRGDGTNNELIKANVTGALSKNFIPSLTENDNHVNLVNDFIDLQYISRTNPLIGTLLFAIITRAPLTDLILIEVVLGLVGETGVFKTATGILSQQCNGPELKEPICNWTSTAKSIELTLQQACNMVVITDDYTPGHQNRQTEEIVELIFGGVGNSTVRNIKVSPTENANAPLIEAVPLITAEIIPPMTQSRKERSIFVKIEKGDVDTNTLTKNQDIAKSGGFAKVNGLYICYRLANNDEIKESIDKVFNFYRTKAYEILGDGYHKRAPSNVADLMLGIHYFANFCVKNDYISNDKEQELVSYSFNNIIALVKLQPIIHEAVDFQVFIKSELSTFFRSTLTMKDFSTISNMDAKSYAGKMIGWRDVENKKFYIAVDSSEIIYQKLPEHLKTILKCGPKSFWAKLKKNKLLVEWDKSNKKNYIRKSFNKKNYCLYSLDYSLIID